MDELDSQLQALALTTQQHPPGSIKRKQALTRLVSAIQKSRQLFCPHRYDYPSDVYDEAIQEVWINIFRKIDNYDPAKAKIMTWVNAELKWRFQDAVIRYNKKRQEVPLEKAGNDEGLVINLAETIRQQEDSMLPSPFEELRQYIEEDPEGICCASHIQDYPKVTFQAIALGRFDGYSWQEMSGNWNIPLVTLSSFYRRQLQKLTPKFREYLQS